MNIILGEKVYRAGPGDGFSLTDEEHETMIQILNGTRNSVTILVDSPWRIIGGYIEVPPMKVPDNIIPRPDLEATP